MMVYISGPSVGMKAGNYKAFDEAAAMLQSQGHQTYNPSWVTRTETIERLNVRMLTYCEDIYMLPHWQNDPSSVWEHRIATQLGLHIQYAPVPDHPVEQVLND